MVASSAAQAVQGDQSPAVRAKAADVGATGVYGPYTLVECHAYGIAGIATGSWSWYSCVQDPVLRLWWLFTV